METVCVGIDTGGTFTDLVAVELERGRHHYHKVPTLTADPAKGILDGIVELLDRTGLDRAAVKLLVLGTTLATNAVLQGGWARTGLITTQGFRDVLELARQRRPHYFNLDIPKPMPPASRDCRFEVEGRIAADGSEVAPLSEEQVASAIAALKEKQVEAVAVCYLHAYANPAHEERTRALVQKLWPDIYLCTSNDVLAEFREFERFASATVNASLMPVMDRYLERFESLSDFRKIIAVNVAALNRAVAELPADRMRMHVCWGSTMAPHHTDVPLRDIIDIVLSAKPTAVSFPAANARHEHEWKIWREVKLPAGKAIVPGVIDSTVNTVEHPEVVADRILNFANVVGRENVIAGVDCGFGTFAGRVQVDTKIVWLKLQSLAEGARLASAQLWAKAA
jgi:hypothetical protein